MIFTKNGIRYHIGNGWLYQEWEPAIAELWNVKRSGYIWQPIALLQAQFNKGLFA